MFVGFALLSFALASSSFAEEQLDFSNDTTTWLPDTSNATNATDFEPCLAAGNCSTTMLETSTENTTEALNTTTKPPDPKDGPRKARKFEATEGVQCSCDSLKGICNINCCCDPECVDSDRSIFSQCSPPPRQDKLDRFCNLRSFIYRNNTPYLLEKSSSGLFCVIRENVPKYSIKQANEPIRTMREAEELTKNMPKWSFKYENKTAFDVRKNSVFGDTVWIADIRKRVIKPLELSDSLVTNVCLRSVGMKFFEDFESTCTQTDISQENAALAAWTYFSNLTVISNFNMTNVTLNDRFFENCPRNICIPITPYLCNETFKECLNVSPSDPRLFPRCHMALSTLNLSCTGLVGKLQYNIYHNGSRGLTEVRALLQLQNLTLTSESSNFEFAQFFAVKYLWANTSYNFSAIRSGAPGYFEGKPILSAELDVNKTTLGRRIHRNATQVAQNFLVLPVNLDGFCVLNEQKYNFLTFGINRRHSCRIKSVPIQTKTKLDPNVICREIQKNVILLMGLENYLSGRKEKVISQMGDPDEAKLTNWLPVILHPKISDLLKGVKGSFDKNNTLQCLNFAQRLHIEVLYSRTDVGKFQQQGNILGVTYKLAQTEDYPFKKVDLPEGSAHFETNLNFGVRFYDITKPKYIKYVDPPTLEIKLPHDFFYPFTMYNGAFDLMSSLWIAFLPVLLVVL